MKKCPRCRKTLADKEFLKKNGKQKQICNGCSKRLKHFRNKVFKPFIFIYIKAIIEKQKEQIGRCMGCGVPFNYKYKYISIDNYSLVERGVYERLNINNIHGLYLCDECKAMFNKEFTLGKEKVHLSDLSPEEIHLLSEHYTNPRKERKKLDEHRDKNSKKRSGNRKSDL